MRIILDLDGRLLKEAMGCAKTHNIPEVLNLIPDSVRPTLSAEEQERLTDYATVLRYPGDWEPITREDAEAAVEVARKVRAAVRRYLPDAVSMK